MGGGQRAAGGGQRATGDDYVQLLEDIRLPHRHLQRPVVLGCHRDLQRLAPRVGVVDIASASVGKSEDIFLKGETFAFFNGTQAMWVEI